MSNEINKLIIYMMPFVYTIFARYKVIPPKKSTNQLSQSEQWSTFAGMVDRGFQES